MKQTPLKSSNVFTAEHPMLPKSDGCIRVVSLNLNGLRSAHQKGVLEWIEQSDADVVCMQETRLQTHQWLDHHKPPLWYTHLYPAQRAGYAGTAIYSRLPFVSVKNGLGFELCDSEGRFTVAEFERPSGGTFAIASVYFPSGSSSDEAQARKDHFLAQITPILADWRAQNRSIILCGDVNIAHKEIDLKNWKGNLKNSGFLPHERAWMDQLFSPTHLGYVDAFRHHNPRPDEYSWWSNRGQAWAKNVGWRIDYQMTSPDWQDRIEQVSIYREHRFSDHAPVMIDYRL
jgi:exodeoxyribonuclease-3